MLEEDNSSIIEFSEDITNAEAPPPLPPGEYRAEIRAAEPMVSNNTGNRYARTHYYIAPEDYPADFDPELNPDGITLKYNMVSLEDTPKGRFSIRRYCEAIGAPMSKIIDLNAWIGLEARVIVTNSEYDGMQIAQIDKVSPA